MGIFSKLTTFYLSNRIKSINNNKGNASKDQASLLIDLLNIPDNYDVLFLQGGASLQFSILDISVCTAKITA